MTQLKVSAINFRCVSFTDTDAHEAFCFCIFTVPFTSLGSESVGIVNVFASLLCSGYIYSIKNTVKL